jgi:hypothetical protein
VAYPWSDVRGRRGSIRGGGMSKAMALASAPMEGFGGGRGTPLRYDPNTGGYITGGRFTSAANFDIGTPNTSPFAASAPNVDSKGGFNAVLHPNEAVIPLPDGRSVPVSINPGMFSNQMPGGGSGRAIVINKIDIQIVAKDVTSFNASQDQIAQKLHKTLRRAVENIGEDATWDDPTRRA